MGVFLIVSTYTFVMDFLIKHEQKIDSIGYHVSNPNRIVPDDQNYYSSQIEIVDLD